MNTPLADRIRPSILGDIVGQKHILANDKPLYRIIENGKTANLIFYGPSGSGKTTVASYIAKKTNLTLKKLNGTTASISDIKQIISETNTFSGINGILLYLDEIQYFNKKQQQSLLEFIEDGRISLIASTTENPYFYVYNAILSRSTVFEFKQVEPPEVEKAIERAISILSSEEKIEIALEPAAKRYMSVSCGGDVRKALNALDLAVSISVTENNKKIIKFSDIEALTQKSSMSYDKDGDAHYDIVSAYQKSMRGSDPDAAIHYLSRLLEAGDLQSACRRLLVCAAEDVGLACPQALPIVKSCVDMALQLGMPEARIPLANAVILVCNAPKSNSAYLAVDKALNDIQKGNSGIIPRCLQNKHCDGADVQNPGQFYMYPHDYPNHYIEQQYLPEPLKNTKYYKFGNNKNEQAYKAYWEQIKRDKL